MRHGLQTYEVAGSAKSTTGSCDFGIACAHQQSMLPAGDM